jgi:hypothetical protein
MDHICFDIICIMYFGSFGRILEHFVKFLKWLEKKFKVIFRSIFRPLFISLLDIYWVSHNTWDYKNALGRPLYEHIENWEVSHFEAKYHTFQTRGVRLWCGPKIWMISFM